MGHTGQRAAGKDTLHILARGVRTRARSVEVRPKSECLSVLHKSHRDLPSPARVVGQNAQARFWSEWWVWAGGQGLANPGYGGGLNGLVSAATPAVLPAV